MKKWQILKKYIPDRHPLTTYLTLWFVLLMLTGLIVTAAGLNLGRLGVIGIMIMAVAQSVLVILYFIQVDKEYLIFKFLLAVALFILITIMIFTVVT